MIISHSVHVFNYQLTSFVINITEVVNLIVGTRDVELKLIVIVDFKLTNY